MLTRHQNHFVYLNLDLFFDLNDDNWEEMKTCTTDDAWQRLVRTVVSRHSSSISSSLHQQQIDSQSPELCRLHGIVKATQAHN